MSPLLAVAIESGDRSLLAARLFTFEAEEAFDEGLDGLVSLAVEARITIDTVLVMS